MLALDEARYREVEQERLARVRSKVGHSLTVGDEGAEDDDNHNHNRPRRC